MRSKSAKELPWRLSVTAVIATEIMALRSCNYLAKSYDGTKIKTQRYHAGIV